MWGDSPSQLRPLEPPSPWEQLPVPGLTGNVAPAGQKPPCPWCPWPGHVPQLSVPAGVGATLLHFFPSNKKPPTFPQADNHTAVPVCPGEWFGQPCRAGKPPSKDESKPSGSSYSWDCCELEAAPQAPHNQGAPHAQLLSPSVLQFKTIYLLRTILLDRKLSVSIITCELIFTSPRISPRVFPEEQSQHVNDFLVHSG